MSALQQDKNVRILDKSRKCKEGNYTDKRFNQFYRSLSK